MGPRLKSDLRVGIGLAVPTSIELRAVLAPVLAPVKFAVA